MMIILILIQIKMIIILVGIIFSDMAMPIALLTVITL